MLIDYRLLIIRIKNSEIKSSQKNNKLKRTIFFSNYYFDLGSMLNIVGRSKMDVERCIVVVNRVNGLKLH